MRDTPAKAAVAPTIAYTDGVTQLSRSGQAATTKLLDVLFLQDSGNDTCLADK
jgi:hypothetical protein